MEFLTELWLRLCHWTQFDVMEDEASAEEMAESLQKTNIPLKLRARTGKEGKTEYVLYVRDADRDLARYYTGWRF